MAARTATAPDKPTEQPTPTPEPTPTVQPVAVQPPKARRGKQRPIDRAYYDALVQLMSDGFAGTGRTYASREEANRAVSDIKRDLRAGDYIENVNAVTGRTWQDGDTFVAAVSWRPEDDKNANADENANGNADANADANAQPVAAS